MKLFHASLLLTALCAGQTFAAPIDSGFTYQGKLNDGGAPANGNYDMIFNLYDAPTDGNVLGTFSIFGAVPVSNGLFTVELNANNEFGPNAFNGSARWLQIGVRTNNNNAANNFVYLNPRQALNCAPQAMFAQSASNAANANVAATVADGAITGSKLASGAVHANNLAAGAVSWNSITDIPAGFADGVDNGATYTAGAGLNLSWVNQFSVDFGGSGSGASVAHSDHDHFGAVWGGNTSYGKGLSVTNSSTTGAAGLYGQQGTGSGFPYIFGNTAGVWGESSQGSGVWGASGYATGAGVGGVATATNGANKGVYGVSLSSSGTGVHGNVTTTNGATTGVLGQSASSSGLGVHGTATSATGGTIGVRGDVSSGNGNGVLGYASALWGDANGVYGESAALNGAGVFGRSTFVTGNGPNYGVRGQSDSIYGYGVFGHTTSANGRTYGVAGQSDSMSGYGVYGLGASGVVGKSDASYGVGVVGQSDAVQGFGVVARSQSGISLKAAGTGVIQSDADSIICIPGSAALGYGDHDATYVKRNGSPRITYALTVPAVLYGQQTTLKSIEIFWDGVEDYDGDVHITGTRVYSGDYDYPNPLVYKDTTTRSPYPSNSYTIQVNSLLNDSSLPLNLAIDAVAPAHLPDYLTFVRIYRINLRFGHN